MKAYAAYHRNEDVLRNSSSGGIFTAMAAYVIEKQGCVICSYYDSAIHGAQYRICTTMAEVETCRGSVYIQSSAKNCIQSIPNACKSYPMVLIVGTPCQIAGMQKYLKTCGVDSKNVYFCDLFCHGVPSPTIWKQYVKMLENQEKKQISYVKFKDKRNGWLLPFAHIKCGEKEISIKDYVRLYYSSLMLRPCCYHCTFTSTDRPGDLSIGDFWKIEQYAPEMNNYMGVSTILISSSKGEDLLNHISCDLCLKEMALTQSMQQCLEQPIKSPENRKQFWCDLQRENFEEVFLKYTHVSFKTRLVNKILRTLHLKK